MSARLDPASGRRSRLTPEREGEIYAAVVQSLREVGYEALSMQEVAVRAKCSTATLYRKWQGKPALVVAALRHQQPHPDADPEIDTGSLRGDLHALADRLASIAPTEHELMAAMAHAALGQPELARIMREQLADPAEGVLDRALHRAMDRGEISSRTPGHAFSYHLMFAVALARPMMEGCQADEEYLKSFVDAVLLPALEHPAPLS
ncbi:TetR/AcrR family transcriptional regulator [Streptomyces sp. NPDC101455]|uniref:TetR/AcrR family transcriptional regulator n=1 Tax=Streptomyces sp. NPDC101455 TaxID=3366142 RepID=UPI0037F9EE84